MRSGACVSALLIAAVPSGLAACATDASTDPDVTHDAATALDVDRPATGGDGGLDAMAVDDGSVGDGSDATDATDATDAAPRTRPNIVVVMADDLDQPSFGFLRDQHRLPHITESVIDPGTVFTNSFAVDPICCPSRATFLSGQYPHNHHVYINLPSSSTPLGVVHGGVGQFDESSTIATWLHGVGYRTCMIGKYLNGYGSSGHPSDVPPGWTDWQVLVEGYTYTMYGFRLFDNAGTAATSDDHVVSPTGYQTDDLAQRAAQFIRDADRRDDAQPFFLVVAPAVPHTEQSQPSCHQRFGCIRPPPRYDGAITMSQPHTPAYNEADVSDKPRWVQNINMGQPLPSPDLDALDTLWRERVEATMALDDMVGTIATALADTNELENTVFVFLSDNGFLLGQHRATGKQNEYEASIRVPILMRVPGMGGGRTIDGVVANDDLAPTFADLAGATPSRMVDGRSLVPLLEDPTRADWRREILIEHWQEGSVEIPNYIAARTAPDRRDAPNHLWVRFTYTPDRELYDLGADPFELTSRHDDPSTAAVRGELDRVVGALRPCAGASCRAAEDM